MQRVAEISEEHTNLSGHRIGDYICSKVLGSGQFACVYKGFNVNNKDQVVAIKVIDKSKYQIKGKQGQKFLKLLDAEAQGMAMCNSDHIVKCYKQYSTEKYTVFILQYCNNNSLFQQIQKRKKIPQQEAKRILKQLIVAFAEMHKNKIIHRDLKPENVFKHNQKYKIGDFGFCKIFQDLNDLTRTPLGSMVSMAPEVLDAAPYGIKADLWSLATVYYEMLYGNPPYISFSAGGMRRAIQQNRINLENISDQSAEFFKRIFVPDVDQRLSWTQLYKLALFRSQSMVMYDTHQDDIDLDEAYDIHKTIQNIQKLKDDDERLKQTLRVKQSSMIQQLAEEYEIQSVPSRIMHQFNQKQVYGFEKDKQMLLYKDRLNFQMQKSIFIYNQIYLPLSQLNIASNREVAQFNVMIISRSFYVMSPLYDALKNHKNKFGWKYYQDFLKDSNHKSFLKDFEIHYKQIKSAQQKSFAVLGNIEQGRFQQFKDFFRKSLFSRSQFQQQRVFLDGVEGLDYTAEQHTKFLRDNYMKVIQNMISQNYGENKNQLKTLYRSLQAYAKISLLEYQQKDKLKQVYQRLKIKYEYK